MNKSFLLASIFLVGCASASHHASQPAATPTTQYYHSQSNAPITKAPRTAPVLDDHPAIWVHPRYPQQAAKKGLEGWVLFKFDVDENCKTKNIEVVDASPHGIFEEEALKAMKRRCYLPADQQGREAVLAFKIVKDNH